MTPSCARSRRSSVIRTTNATWRIPVTSALSPRGRSTDTWKEVRHRRNYFQQSLSHKDGGDEIPLLDGDSLAKSDHGGSYMRDSKRKFHAGFEFIKR